ncbi:MAG: hypothetical protein U0174_24940 [Polyangiaceae bacterium]
MLNGSGSKLWQTLALTLFLAALFAAWACGAIPSYSLANEMTSPAATLAQDAAAGPDVRQGDRDSAPPTDAGDAATQFRYRVFVSSNGKQGDFGLLPDGGRSAQAQADESCRVDYLGQYGGSTAKWRAFLWVDEKDPRTTFGNDAPGGWYNVGDTQDLPVLTTLKGTPIPSRPILNVVGQTPASYPWVGSMTNNCNGWTDRGASLFALVGFHDAPSRWLGDVLAPSCGNSQTFYCFQLPTP